MIEISHKQAQHLIREAQDRRLPEEQWAVLHAHLENCPDCRAYREQIGSYEKNLRRLLHTRWGAARGPGGRIAERIIRFRARRKKTGKIIGRGAIYLLGIALVVGYLMYRDATAPPPAPPPAPTAAFGFAPIETATPSPLRTEFSQVIAFESHQDGNAEVYLLNGSPDGPQFTNLTHSPAQDTQPAWSPDGQWLAFLSDRTGKTEVFITHVAGSRLTQITNAPQLEWAGPIAWSYDGKWLGLSGRRGGLNGPSFLYLIPLDGQSQPSSIAYTYLAEPWIRFSPGQPALAYLSAKQPGGIDVVNTETGWTGTVTLEESQSLGLVSGQGGAFDWSLGGRSLVFLAHPEGEAQPGGTGSAQIRISNEVAIFSQKILEGTQAKVVDTLPPENRVRAVSWMPNSLIVASLVESTDGAQDENDCWVIRLMNSHNTAQTPRVIPEVCVTGGLEQSNWSPDGKWLVVIGRKPTEETSAYYALRLPEFAGREDTSRGDSLFAGSPYIERLADMPAADMPTTGDINGGQPLFAEPRVRPGGQLKEFVPRAAPPPEPTPAPVLPPAQTRGWIAYRVQNGADSWIVRSRPDGRSNFVLTSRKGEHSCPRVAPDGSYVAYLSDENSSQPGLNEVFITGMDRKNTTQLTRDAFPGEEQASDGSPPPRYDCPAWSPDSKYLAAVVRTTGQIYLAVIPIDGQSPVKYLQIGAVSDFAPPVWVPGDSGNAAIGSSKIVLFYRHTNQLARLVMVNIDGSGTLEPAKTEVLEQLYTWDDAQDMVISPDGKRLAVSLIFQNAVNSTSIVGKAVAKLMVFDMDRQEAISEIDMPDYDPGTAGLGGLAWLPDGRVGLARIGALIGPDKTVFERFDPDISRLQNKFDTMTSFDEVTYMADWIDGNWVVFVSESGLWVLNVEEAQAKRASPALLSGEAITDVDWR